MSLGTAILMVCFLGPLCIGAARSSGYEHARGVHWFLDLVGFLMSIIFLAVYTWAVVVIARGTI